MRVLLVLLAACAPSATDTAGPTDSGAEDDTGTGGEHGVPDLTDLEARTFEDPGCETFDAGSGPKPVPGATGWYLGRFTVGGGRAEGVEEWLLYANDTWTEGHDCRVVWRAGGQRADCDACTHRLDLAMLLDHSATTCPAALVADQPRAFEVTYLVDVAAEVARFRFESGAGLGEGPAGDDVVAYVAGPSCKWF